MEAGNGPIHRSPRDGTATRNQSKRTDGDRQQLQCHILMDRDNWPVRRLLLVLILLLCAAFSTRAAAVAHRVSTASTTNATSYASGAFTPTAGELLTAQVVCT